MLIYNETKDINTEDLQHDLALMITSPEYMEDLIIEYTQELEYRKEKLPINCRFEHNIYARFKQELEYDLENQKWK